MATIGETSMNPPQSKPVVVRVKRKAHQSRLDAFWLEINEKPTKKAMLDLEKLSISNNSVDVQVEELKAKKVLVKHVETVTSMETTMEIVQSFASNSAHVVEEQKRTIKKYSKQEQILSRSRRNQEVLASDARFEQIWRSRRGDKGASEDKALHDICSFYDVVRVEESFNEVQELEVASLEDQKILSSYLPLLREFLPSAVAEVESDIHAYLSNQGSAFDAIPLDVDDYVYDYYTVKDDMDINDIETASPFPLVKVEEEDFYDGPDDESEYDTDDSNAEDHPRNDYPDEASLDDHESESEASLDESEREEEEEEEEESDAPSIKHSEYDDADNFDDHGSYFDYPECEYGSDDED
ncbi:RNA-directed DNA methylation 4 isoform X1 [Populus nigra]|uniref:RNA-directed DNA methylation 4 isoform X1 n=1 Tax=Populus nigra TaxID=3691 RepID=UPI002B264F15|nr:RNA-directed DNA methylation 4 isoform X1 [Populus nigra]